MLRVDHTLTGLCLLHVHMHEHATSAELWDSKRVGAGNDANLTAALVLKVSTRISHVWKRRLLIF